MGFPRYLALLILVSPVGGRGKRVRPNLQELPDS
jgi:hypothetical protein